MKAVEMRQKSAQELSDLLVELRKQQFELRMAAGTGQLAEPHKLRQVRRDIARVKTVLNGAKDRQA